MTSLDCRLVAVNETLFSKTVENCWISATVEIFCVTKSSFSATPTHLPQPRPLVFLSHAHPSMLPELSAHRGRVLSLLCVAAGLWITVRTVGGRLDRWPGLLNAVAGLAGLPTRLQLDGRRRGDANSAVKRRQKRLYFTDSCARLLWMTEAPVMDAIPAFSLSTEVLTKLQSGLASCVSVRRRRTCYILMSASRDRPVLALSVGTHGSVLRRCSPPDQLRWALEFSCRAQGRGDTVFLFLTGQTRRVDARSATPEPGRGGLLLSALVVLFLWTSRPFLAVCVAICWGWLVLEPASRVLQRPDLGSSLC